MSGRKRSPGPASRGAGGGGAAPAVPPARLPWKRLGLLLCVLSAAAQLSLSPTSRAVLFSGFTTLPTKKAHVVRGTRGSSASSTSSSSSSSSSSGASTGSSSSSSSSSASTGSWQDEIEGFLAGLTGSGSSSSSARRASSSSSSSSSSSGSSSSSRPARAAKSGPDCPSAATGPPLDYAAAVKRYMALPWTMRRPGARLPPSPPDQHGHNLTCFAGPYTEGGELDAAPCGMEGSVYYPTAPPPRNGTIAVPDLAREKMERCAALKAGILRPAASRRSWPNMSVLPVIQNANISCGPEQLCFYPRPLPLGEGGFSEAVNTELGVEIGAYLPFFHYEASIGELAQSNSNYDSSAFYFWSARHCEWDTSVQRAANGIGGRTPWPYNGLHFGFVNPLVKRDTYPRERFLQAPWGPHFCGWGLFPFLGQRYAFIHNKRKLVEFMGRMVNTIHPPTLTQLYDLLKDHYVVVYQRPTAGLFKSENDGFQESVDDITTLEAHAAKVGGTLYVMPRLLKDFQDAARAQGLTADDVSLNEVQMTILAEADIHISVQGGPAYMSMLWGARKPALLVQRKSPELPNEAHTWFDLISGMTTETTYSDRDLVVRVRDLYYAPLLSAEKRAALAAGFHGVTTPAHRAYEARLRERCLTLLSSSGGGRSRFELCPFRSASQIVFQSEEVYMLGYWEGGHDELSGAYIAPGGSWVEGEGGAGAHPRGMRMGGGKDCEGNPGQPRRAQVWFSCVDPKQAEPELVEAGEPDMCVYNLNVTLPGDLCAGKW